MLVQTDSNRTLKIILTPREVKKLFGNTVLSLRSRDAQRIINMIYLKTVGRVSFKPKSNKLLVELKRQKNGGCFFSFTDTAEQSLSTLVLEFENTDDLLSALDLLPDEKSIYKFENKYRVITKTDEETLFCLSEFCGDVYYSSTEIARTKEYGTPIGC